MESYKSREQSRNGNSKARGPSYFHRVGCEPMKMLTAGQALDEAAEKWPNKEAIISHHERKKLTYGRVREEAEKLGAGLLKLGLCPGDRLALIGVNSIHWYLTALAAAKAGIVLVLLNPGYRAQEMGYALKKVKAKAILTDQRFKTQDYPAILAELVPAMADAPHAQPMTATQLPGLAFVIVATEERLPGCYRLQDIMNLTNDKEIVRAVEKGIQPDDPFCIMFSSGTTDIPKAAVLSHFSIVNAAFNVQRRTRQRDQLTCLLVPFFHIFGVCVGIIHGLCFGIPQITPGPIFVKELAIEALQTYKVETIHGTPTMLFDLYNELKVLLPNNPKLQEDCGNVDLIGSGGSFISADLINKMSEIFPHSTFVGALGMTEAGAVCFLLDRNDNKEKKESTIGSVVDHLEVKVVDQDGKMVPFGTPGEAWYRSSFSLLEYWEDEEKTKQSKLKSGWFKSGDVISLSEDGYATVKGRVKEMINRGGENIFPVEVENFLNQHPEILQAEVYGVSDERLGEEVAASIIILASSKLTEESLKAYCKGKIAHFKIPRYIRFVEQFPLTATRKVKKYILREMLEKELKEQNI